MGGEGVGGETEWEEDALPHTHKKKLTSFQDKKKRRYKLNSILY